MNYPKIDYNRLFTLVDHIGPELDDRKNRFDKSDLLEQAVEEYSGGELIWVDEEGWDHVIKDTGKLSEQKTQKNCLYTKKGSRKNKTSPIRLQNTLGDVNNSSYSPKYDYLQIVDTGGEKSYSMAITTPEIVEKYVEKSKDCFTVQIPLDELEFLCHPEDVSIYIRKKGISYLAEKRQAQKNLIQQY